MASSAWIFWSLAVLLGAGAAYMLYAAFLRDRARGRLRCPRCWFDMRGAPGLVCPECGHDARVVARLSKTRWHYGHLAVAILLALGSYFNARMPGILASGDWSTSIPEPLLLAVAPVFDKRGDTLMNSGFSSKTLSLWDRMLVARACARTLLSCTKGRSEGAAESDPRFYPAEQGLLGLGADARYALPTIIAMLGSGNGGEWKSAVRVIETIGPSVPATLRAIESVLQDADPSVRLHGACALDAFPGNPGATELMVGAMRDPNAKVRRKAASVFDHAGYDPSGKHLERVIASIRAPGLSTEQEGVAALAGYGPRSVLPMVELIDHPLATVRVAVISNLSGYGRVDRPPAGVIEALRGALGDPDSTVRNGAVRALGQWGDEAGIAAADILALCGESNLAVLVRCSALLTIGRVGVSADEAVPVLVRALDDAEPSVRRCAAEGLRSFGSGAAGAGNTLEAHRMDPNADVRAEVATTLRALRGDQAR